MSEPELDGTAAYLRDLRSRTSAEEVLGLLDGMRDLRVGVVGDAILDDYHFGRTLGVSSKAPSVVLHHTGSELHAGGALAVANHLARFAGAVELVCVLGDDHGEFVDEALSPAVERRFVRRPGAPTTLKRRFVDEYFGTKVFEVYRMDDSPLDDAQERAVADHLGALVETCDLVLAADFGHGALSEGTRALLCGSDAFLAVNTQANAGNRGFHTIGRYARADFASLSEGELRLEYRDTRGELAPHVVHARERLGARAFVVTRGGRGATVLGADGALVEAPSLTPRVVDRVGAGDALFALTAMAARLEASPEQIAFLGNVAGALAVEIMGNRRPIDRESVDTAVRKRLA